MQRNMTATGPKRARAQPVKRMTTIARRRGSCRLFAALSLSVLAHAGQAHTKTSKEANRNNHASSPDRHNANATSDDRADWKRRRRPRIARSIFLPEQSSKGKGEPVRSERPEKSSLHPSQQLQQLYGDVRNQYKVDDSLIDDNAENILYDTKFGIIGNDGNAGEEVQRSKAMPDLRIINGVLVSNTVSYWRQISRHVSIS